MGEILKKSRHKLKKSIPCFLFIIFVFLSSRILLFADIQVQFSLRSNQDIIYGDSLAILDLYLSNQTILDDFNFDIIVEEDSFVFEKLEPTQGVTVTVDTSDETNINRRFSLKINHTSSEQRKVASLYFKKKSNGYSDIKIDNVTAVSGEDSLTVTPFAYGAVYAPNYPSEPDQSYQNKPGDLGNLAFSNPNPEDLTTHYQEENNLDNKDYSPVAERTDRSSNKIVLFALIVIVIALVLLIINLIKSYRINKNLKNRGRKKPSTGSNKK